MSVTINAYQLGRLIDSTADHIGDESLETLHGIRLDSDGRHLHAIATDRYTLAVARYKLNDNEHDQAFARTIRAQDVPALREWVKAVSGHSNIAISTEPGRLALASPHTELRIAVTDSLEFPDWRALVRSTADLATEQRTGADEFPAFDSRYLARWNATGAILHVRVNVEMKAALFLGEDFIGMQMPVRINNRYKPSTFATFDDARTLWAPALDASETGLDMATVMAAVPESYNLVTKDVQETTEALLRQTLRCTSDSMWLDVDDPDLLLYSAMATVQSWSAYRYLDALRTADPRLAASIVADVAEQLDSGEIGEWAWDQAEQAGHDPQKWQEQHEEHRSKQGQKRRAKWEAAFNQRLADALNEALRAGISLQVEPNERVALDVDAGCWVAVEPQPATA